jgi:hypothetical protein
MSLDAFVKKFFTQSAWTDEEGMYKRRGYKAGIIQGWFTSSGSQEQIAIAQFGNANGAISAFDGLSQEFRDKPSSQKLITDSADGAVGTVDPTMDSDGNAFVDIVAHSGDYMIDVHEFTPVTADPAAAEALLLKQVKSLRDGS